MIPDLTLIPIDISGSLFYRTFCPQDLLNESQKNYAKKLHQHSISHVILLLTPEEAFYCSRIDLTSFYKDLQLTIFDFSLPDRTAPKLDLINSQIKLVIDTAMNQPPSRFLIHCLAGIGRTGTFLTCLAIKNFLTNQTPFSSPYEAIKWIRQFIPEAVETIEQDLLIQDFFTLHTNL